MGAKSDGNVRAIGRALAVLRAINRHGSLTMTQIAHLAELPYPTTFRIVETLIEEGMVEQERSRKNYRPTPLVQTLSLGFQQEDRIAVVARPHIVALTKQVSWPISLCTRVGLNMMIRDSTHSMTSLTFSLYHPGFTFPILESSSGRVYLAFCTAEEYTSIIGGLERLNGGTELRSAAAIERVLQEVRETGFAVHDRTPSTADPGKNSSISVALFQNGIIVGTITLVFFASSMAIDRAIRRYADILAQTAKHISLELSQPTELPN